MQPSKVHLLTIIVLVYYNHSYILSTVSELRMHMHVTNVKELPIGSWLSNTCFGELLVISCIMSSILTDRLWCHNKLTALCYCTHTHTHTHTHAHTHTHPHSPGSLPQSTIFPPWWLLSPPPRQSQPLLKPLPDLPCHPATNACSHLCGPELQQTHWGACCGPDCSAEPGECRLEGESPPTWGEGTASVNGQSESDYRWSRGRTTMTYCNYAMIQFVVVP